MKTADFNKNPDGLLPAIIQDSITQKVLMLGYMNAESLKKTQNSRKVTFPEFCVFLNDSAFI